MQAKMWKEARRVLAVFMAFAMVVTSFSSIPVKADEGSESIDVLNVSAMEEETIAASKTVGAFTINAAEGKEIVIDGNEKKIDNFSFTKRLKLGGSGDVSSRNIEYEATGAATMTVYAVSSSSSNDGSTDRKLVLADANGTVGEQVALGSGLSKLTYNIPSAGTYYLFSAKSGINLYYIAVEYAEDTSETESETVIESGTTTESESDTATEETTETESSGKKEWNFSSAEFLAAVAGSRGDYSFDGLEIKSGQSHQNQYLYLYNGATVTIPVQGDSIVTVNGHYAYSFYFEDNSSEIVSTSGTVSNAYTYKGEAGTVSITATDQCYLTSITVEKVELEDDTTEKDTESSTDAPTEVPTLWDFSAADFNNGTYKDMGNYTYNSLIIKNGRTHNSKYLYLTTDSTVSIPVKGDCEITVYGDYDYAFYFENDTNTLFEESTPGKYEYKGGAGTVTFTSTQTSYITKIVVEPVVVDEDTIKAPASVKGKLDVWDLGAEQLDDTKYVNKLSVDMINSWYSEDIAVGSVDKNNTLASFEVLDENGNVAFGFEDGGFSNTHRLRTSNEKITRYDNNSKEFGGVKYKGFIYSNKSNSEAVYIEMYAKAGDIFTFAVGSNSGDADYVFKAPSGKTQTQTYVASEKGTLLTFYAAETGNYKLYAATEKLVLCRAYVQHPEIVTVSGNVEAPATIPSEYKIAFTNDVTGVVTEASVENGKYSVDLCDSYTYTVSLKNANGFIVTSENNFELPYNTLTSKEFDIAIEEVTLVTVTGSFVGVDKNVIDAMTIEFVSEEIYVPEIEITGTAYTAQFQKGIEYEVVIKGINDYQLVNPTTVKFAEGGTQDITIEKKPVYKVTINSVGATADDLAEAKFVFTNLKEEGYVYTFTGTNDIYLRDGVYSVEVKDSGAFVQLLTSNVVVNGAALTKTIEFNSDITEWSFVADDYNSQKSYNGLVITGGKKHGTTYGMTIKSTDTTNASVVVPVKGACEVVVTVGYSWDISFDDSTVRYYKEPDGGFENISYSYTGGAGTVTINVGKDTTTYIKAIKLVTTVPYKEVITVGAKDCDYKTINEALDAISGMNRTEAQRVTVEIQPGDYEEMLVVDVPNVTFKNASATPSIELKNKGVDIDANAVRITSYYGHGYTYYSMGDDCKYDEKVLQVNKENGYASFENPGSGTTAGSYWNATVVVTASGFEAEGIIFENSFNQYVSKKAANDVIVAQSSAKEGSVKRADMKVGDTTVQDKAYVERAAALAIGNNVKNVSFDNCKFIGRQDTLYGGTGTTAAFYDCAVYGGTDYIFGGMTAVFAKCDLVFNTSENKNDVGYITAAQTPANTRGMLLYNCTVTSTIPGVDTASEYPSKAGYLGRPWAANTGEAVFYNTIIEATDSYWYKDSASLIYPAGWLSTLSGESKMSAEYGTYEMAKDVDNQSARVAWATTLTEPKLADGTEISVAAFLGDWDAFAGKDMTVVIPTDKVDNKPVEEEEVTTVQYVFDAATEEVVVKAEKGAAISEGKYGADGYFTFTGSLKRGNSSTYSVELGKTETGKISFTVTTTADAKFVVTSTGGSNKSDFALVDSNGNKVVPNGSSNAIVEVVGTSPETEIKYTDLEAGTYYVVAPKDGSNKNRGVRVLKAEVEEVSTTVTTDYTFDAATEEEVVKAEKGAAISEGKYGTDGYFTFTGSLKRGNSSSYSVELGKTETGKVAFKVTGTADAKFVVTSTGSSNKSDFALIDSNGNKIVPNGSSNAIVEVVGTSPETEVKYTNLEAGTYYVVAPKDGANKNRGFRVLSATVTETTGGSRPPRADWSTVAAPEIVNVEVNKADANKIDITVKALVDYDGADTVTVSMLNAAGEVIGSANSAQEGTEHTVTLTPGASGTYTITVKMVREGETDKVSAETKAFDFVLPLVAPNIKGAYNAGKGNVEVEWDAVKEATKYVVSAVGTEVSVETTALTATLEGLEVGKTYTIKVEAVRGDESKSATTEITVKDEVEVKWYFSAYGSGTNTKDNGYEVLEDGSVRVYSTGGKGKIVPGSTDGIAYYYTLIDPATTNFTLKATAVVNNWTLSNGQEGFGIMATDRVGIHGDGTSFWNNSYQAIASKVEYYYDNDLGKVTDDSSYGKITMKLGIGSIEKIGVTDENLADFNANNTEVLKEKFSSTTVTLEDSCGKQFGSGTFNIVGNYTGEEPTGTVENTLTEITFTIQKNNTGYFVSYTDAEGNTTTQKYYDTEALSQIVDDSVAIGFFASRNADITFKDITFTTIASKDDAPAEERPVTLVTPIASVLSGTVANSADYELTYYANFDGTVTIKGASGVIVNNATVEADKKYTVNVPLKFGNNNFTVVATPDADYVPGEFAKLSSYDAISFTHTVNYKAYGDAGETLYVAPDGSASGVGTEAKPLDIYTAVKYAQPGQTIILKEGTYKLSSTVKVERGIDGTEENRINMIADPNASTRPVLDFQGICAGVVLAGDYWYFQGFDVTNSADAQKGIQVSGNYNVLDQIHTYKNGNTGIQISRYLGTDEYADWPAYNLILNCTSWENADKGREDADGFAAKLTVGDGNVFDGCVAHHNADDGWDLFAKVQTGSIGSVTIKNSVAYKNGYEFDETGKEILGTGNGNGFKMGGDSMTGGHILENSIAFNNKEKGIDSNSCPDIKVYNSITFNNRSYNVAFYTNTAANTDYEASGIVSYRTENLGQAEQFKLVGTQDQNKVYGDTNYYWDATKQVSANKAGEEVKADWFKSLEFTGITRNEDGTINMNGFLELTENAKVDASLGGNGSVEIKPGEPTDGTVTDTSKPSSGSSGSGSSGSGSYDDEDEEEDNVIKDIIDTIVDAITGGNKDKEKEEVKEEVKVPEGTDELVKDLVADILSGESVGTAVSEETAEKIAEAIKEGKTIVTETVTTVLEASQVPAEEKEAIEALVSSIAEKESGIAQYLDLSVLIGTTEGDTLGNYHETAQSIEFTVEIPSDMQAEGRTFFVVRIHNGKAEALETTDNGDGTITFKTNKFSTYAIAYMDGEVADLPVVDDKTPVVDQQPVVNDVVEESGSGMGILAVVAVLLLAVGSFLITKKKKASEQDGLN